ncbi:unnamed protein product [Fusarium fujikuroi]|uniref:Uncharacterized protein n=1 Tax=Fusarium fujikuroi TaxID=5127 RepID=A0A9Q9S2D5_FUSFU|nr:unnamed protein product [Fusarium fujikuroi]VTT84290.1 unnamed protein product [Fusarium fujikuroi]VZH88822.1 unnamed protein product [Fusarium fujikuroi]
MLSNKTTGYGIKYLPKHSPLPQSSNCARPATQQTLTTSQACVQFELAQPPDSPSHTIPYRAVAYHADLGAIVSSDFTANYLSIAQGGRVSIQG